MYIMTTRTSGPMAERIIDIMAAQIKLPKEQSVPGADFSTDPGFDSPEQMELIMAL